MLKPFLVILITAFILSLIGCQYNNNKQETQSESEIVSVEEATEMNAEESQMESNLDNIEREPTDDEIREYGMVRQIEDGVYPMFVMRIEFPERQMSHDFNLNRENLSINITDIYSLLDQYVSFYYLSEMQNDLHDIHFNGNSLYGDYNPEMIAQWKSITGVLSGAESETVSDLPSTIYVEDQGGQKLAFDLYIEPEVVAVNGKEVTVYYDIRGVETITYIHYTDD